MRAPIVAGLGPNYRVGGTGKSTAGGAEGQREGGARRLRGSGAAANAHPPQVLRLPVDLLDILGRTGGRVV